MSHHPEVRVSTITNGSLLSANADRLVESGLQHVLSPSTRLIPNCSTSCAAVSSAPWLKGSGRCWRQGRRAISIGPQSALPSRFSAGPSANCPES